MIREGIGMKTFPTLKELRDNADEWNNRKKEKHKTKRVGKRNADLCIRFSKLWREITHSVIKKLQKSHDLKWLQVGIS